MLVEQATGINYSYNEEMYYLHEQTQMSKTSQTFHPY
jgi:hypothetical protein